VYLFDGVTMILAALVRW